LRRDITRLIRLHRPEVVMCFDPTNRIFSDGYVNHPDHRASGDATIDAVFPSARDRLTFPELLADGLEPHKVAQLWLGSTQEPNVWVDIADVMDLKKQALLAHPSQLDPGIVDFAEQMGRWMAVGQDFQFAECFRRIVFDQPAMAPPTRATPK
jgi:LmbE family N-acetylglucosaminyl deacetylase